MEHKSIIATIYIRNGRAVRSKDDNAESQDLVGLAKSYNDSGVDKIFLVDLSNDE